MATQYLITGGAGHLGSTILRLLRRTGAPVRALVLPGEPRNQASEQITYYTGDVRDPDSLRPLFEAGDPAETVVIHSAGIIDISGKLSPARRAGNGEGARHLRELGQADGGGRRGPGSGVGDAFDPDLVVGGYAKAKAEATQAVLEAAEAGLDAVVVHPSGILGPYDNGSNHLVHMVKTFLTGKLPGVVRGGYDFVDVRDVAKGCLLAAQSGKKGRCYILSGRFSEIRELLALAGRQIGRRVPPLMPQPLAKAVAPVLEAAALRRHERPLYTRYSLYTLTSNSHFSHERATRELGYHPRNLSATLTPRFGTQRTPENSRIGYAAAHPFCLSPSECSGGGAFPERHPAVIPPPGNPGGGATTPRPSPGRRTAAARRCSGCPSADTSAQTARRTPPAPRWTPRHWSTPRRHSAPGALPGGAGPD